MAAGYQFGAQCYLSAAEAAARACSATHGVTSSGVLACSGVTVVDSTATLSLSNGSTFDYTLMPCDKPTFADTWAPIFGALLVATCVIWGLKQLLSPFRHGMGDE